MAEWMSEYKRKLISADAAAGLVKNGMTVDYYAFNASSRYMDAALAKRAGELEKVTIRSHLRLAPPMQAFMADAQGTAFRLESLFRGPCENFVPADRCSSIPARLGSYEKLFRLGDVKTHVASFMVSPPDNEGYVHFCPSPALAKADAETAEVFVAEINESYYQMRGSDDRKIHISKVDYIVEGDNPPLLEVPNPVPSEIDKKIANHIITELCDGACLQIGYGSVPNAVASLICHSELKDLGIHTEVIPESVVHLYRAGKITGKRKTTDPGKIVACFILGSRDLIEFIRDCPDIHMCSSTYTNDPFVAGRNENFISINGCLQVDLRGQVNSESIITRTISGTGGQLDFVLGAQLSKGGKAILCCPSTYTDKSGKEQSRIVAALPTGAIVTTPQAVVQYVCTEYGIVNLRGRTLRERALLLVSIAHPDFRDQLIEDGKAMGIIC
jgi:acyl-CoA hydrolase